jgi:hypothetical protein
MDLRTGIAKVTGDFNDYAIAPKSQKYQAIRCAHQNFEPRHPK